MILSLPISLHTSIRCNFCGNFSPTCRTVVAQQKTGPFSKCLRRTSASKTGPEMASDQKISVTKSFALPRSIYCPLATPRRASQSETVHSCTFRLCYLQRLLPNSKTESNTGPLTRTPRTWFAFLSSLPRTRL